MHEYIEKPATVTAIEFVDEDAAPAITLVQSVHGPAAERGFLTHLLGAEPGDFIVKHRDGRIEVVKPEDFTERYEASE